MHQPQPWERVEALHYHSFRFSCSLPRVFIFFVAAVKDAPLYGICFGLGGGLLLAASGLVALTFYRRRKLAPFYRWLEEDSTQLKQRLLSRGTFSTCAYDFYWRGGLVNTSNNLDVKK